MIASDVLIVGGGPAGSSCARSLVRAGADVTVIDAAIFPRDKVCAGWITPPVVDALHLDVEDYRHGRTFQPILGFRAGVVGRASAVDVDYGHPISFGIRRCEFDHYLLARSGARMALGEPARDITRIGGAWAVNGRYRAPVLVGAGGHFCPVARRLDPRPGRGLTVAAQEAELVLDEERGHPGACRPDPERPEIYFNPDLRGYGWVFRKERVINVGLGSLDRYALPRAVAAFVAFLEGQGRIPAGIRWPWRGHAYRLYEPAPRREAAEGMLLVGDAAGLAYTESGEGIRPAVESGLLAAQALVEAAGRPACTALEAYDARIRARFGANGSRGLQSVVPPGLAAALGRELLRLPWFVRRVVFDRWFLHTGEQALAS